MGRKPAGVAGIGNWMLRTLGFSLSRWGLWWTDWRGSTHLLPWCGRRY